MYTYKFTAPSLHSTTASMFDFVITGDDDYIDDINGEQPDPDVAIKCYKILSEFLCKADYCTPGHRNDYVVDTCICLAMLGIDIYSWFDRLYALGALKETDYIEAKKKAEVVEPYLEDYAKNKMVREEWHFTMDHRATSMIV